MLGLMLYAIVCFTIAAAFMWLSLIFTKLGSTTDKPAISRLVVLWVFVFAVPYIWVEVCTAIYKKDFDDGVFLASEKGFLEGDLLYYKVRIPFGSTAKIVAVTEIVEDWGGTYRNLYDLEFKRDGSEWHLSAVVPVNTKDGDAAGFTVPPYW